MTLNSQSTNGDDVVLDVRQLTKEYVSASSRTRAIGGLSFSVSRGEFLCIVGPSGCGKSTLLRCMAGLLSPTAGEVLVDGQRIIKPPDTLGLVFQDYSRSLFPWMTVRENIVFPLRRKNLTKAQRRESVEHALESVGLTDFIDHHPWQLSGGMQQRVAIARALAYQPEILLMDEPFASVDAQTRADLEDLVLSVLGEYGVTTVFVTHDIDEAVYLADRVVLLTPAPSMVSREWTVDLPTPRHQISTKELPRFGELRAEVYTRLRGGRATLATEEATP